MESYLEFLPLAQANKGRKIDTGFRSFNPSIGIPIFERLTDDLKTTFDLKFIFTHQQARQFDLWVKHRLNNGSDWFKIPIGIGGSGIQEQVVHFIEMPQITNQTQLTIEYSARVVVKQLKNSDDDHVSEILDYPSETWITLDLITNFNARRQ